VCQVGYVTIAIFFGRKWGLKEDTRSEQYRAEIANKKLYKKYILNYFQFVISIIEFNFTKGRGFLEAPFFS